MKRDHSSALESLAAEHNLNPLEVFEAFQLCASVRRHHAGLSIDEAERLAVEDVRKMLSGPSRTSQTQLVSKCVKEAGAT